MEKPDLDKMWQVWIRIGVPQSHQDLQTGGGGTLISSQFPAAVGIDPISGKDFEIGIWTGAPHDDLLISVWHELGHIKDYLSKRKTVDYYTWFNYREKAKPLVHRAFSFMKINSKVNHKTRF